MKNHYINLIVFIDTDECKENAPNCNHFCTNTFGSYFCFCERGYELDTDNHTCIDIDECLDDNGECDQNCHNTDGSYYCSCDGGYSLNSDRKNCYGIITQSLHNSFVLMQILMNAKVVGVNTGASIQSLSSTALATVGTDLMMSIFVQVKLF